MAVSSHINGPLSTFPDSGNLPAAFEGDGVAWFGEPGTGTYCGDDVDDDFNDVQQTPHNGCSSQEVQDGQLDSPAISLALNGEPGALYSSAELVFDSWWDIEAGDGDVRDLMSVSYSINSGRSWSQIGTLNPDTPLGASADEDYTSGLGVEVTPLWQPYIVDLAPVIAAIRSANADGANGDPTDSVQLRFGFNTVDQLHNGFRGWMLDQLQVQATTTPSPVTPTLSTAAPTCVQPGDSTSVVTLHGTSIPLGSTVIVDGEDAETTFVPSDGVAQFQFDNPDFGPISAGNHTLEIQTPNGETSNQLAFSVSSGCRRPTATAVSCAPASLSIGGQTVCTAEVSDADGASPAPPSGTVTFGGAAPGSCNLAPVPNLAGDTINTADSDCQATLTPTVGGTSALTAAYPGDGTFAASGGQTGLSVFSAGGGAPPPAPGQSSPPAAVTGAPAVTGTSGAAFIGTVTPDGLTTTAHFEYGLDPRYTDGGAVKYTQSTPDQTVGADFAAHTVTAVVSGLLAHAQYHVRLVADNSAGTATGPDQTFTTKADPPPPPPVLGKSFDASVVSGVVFIKLPHGGSLRHADIVPWSITKGAGFQPLTEPRQLPVGTEVDARRGTLDLVEAPPTVKRSTRAKARKLVGTFSSGLFRVTQAARGLHKGLMTLTLLEGAFKGGPTYAACRTGKVAHIVGAAAKSKPLGANVLQTLNASDHHGNFSTRGRYASATVRGTAWSTSDRCDGTLTRVKRGTVDVRDFQRRRTIVVHAGQSYLARAILARKHR